jgi:hypothetical protein
MSNSITQPFNLMDDPRILAFEGDPSKFQNDIEMLHSGEPRRRIVCQKVNLHLSFKLSKA